MSVYVIGDSISIQYGPFLQTYLDGIMDYSRKEGVEEALLNLDNPQGANGGDSGMVLSFVKSKAESDGIDADFLLLNSGLHDIKTDHSSGKRQVSIEKYRENLQEIIEIVKAMKCILIWITTTPFDERVHNSKCRSFLRFSADSFEYNKVADQIMISSGIPTIDLHSFTLNLEGDLYCDHVHFHEHIREKQAAFIAGWLNAFSNINRVEAFGQFNIDKAP